MIANPVHLSSGFTLGTQLRPRSLLSVLAHICRKRLILVSDAFRCNSYNPVLFGIPMDVIPPRQVLRRSVAHR
jgi:hypothetical protein